jgi:alpha-ketoglutarate-dependent taurine dioxygenase
MADLKIKQLADALGAEVSGLDLTQPLGSEVVDALREAWNKHLVLRFRGQRLSDPQLLALTRYFGEIDPPGPNPQGKPYLTDYPEINVISNIKQGGAAIGGLGDGEAVWHTDMTYIPTPPKGALLHALEIPPTGGDTSWANMHLAFANLPAELKKLIADKKAIHDSTYNSAGFMRRGMKEVADPRAAPGAHHPLVVKHPVTGSPSLFLGRRRNSYILGMELNESEELLDELWSHVSRPEYRFTQVWQLHDLMLWDNHSTMHRRDSFDPSARRLMHRTQIKGCALAAYH